MPRTIRLLASLTFGVFSFCNSVQGQSPASIQNDYAQGPALWLKNSKPIFAEDRNATGRVESDRQLQRMVLVLAPSGEQEAELQALIADQHDKRSPNYHHWLTANEFAARFGASSDSVDQVRAWLAGAGLQVSRVSTGRRWLEFSGTVAQVESAFHTKLQYYQVGGKAYISNSTEIAIPAALGGVTRGVLSLNNFGRRPPVKTLKGVAGASIQGQKRVVPNLTASGSTGNTYYVAPGDFAAIYGTKALLSGGIDGSGITIAVTAQSQITLTDVQAFRTIFGLKTNDPNIQVVGPDPGITGQLDAEEALLDAEWAGAVAPGATIDVIIAGSTDTTSGVDLAAAYAIDNEVAPILTYTYGACEQALGSTGNAFYNALWQQAAAEGITVLVATGDNGAAGCDNPTSGVPAQYGPAVNGVAATPYNVAIGGTEFNDGTQPSTYWNATNASDYSSAIGYIPEAAWNESCDPGQAPTPTNCAYGNTNMNLLASGGGASATHAKPDWQTGTGVPSDGARDIPDLAFASAATHDDYVYCTSLGGLACQINSQQEVVGLTLVGGTSVATPAMAGLLALIEQKNGAFQGQINFTLYRLAATAANVCDSSQQTNPATANSCVFYDIRSGNNDVPCAGGSPGCSSTTSGTNGVLHGYSAGPGYDLVTGLGSVNAANLANAWTSATYEPSQVTLQGSGLSAVHGTPIALNGTVTSTASTATPTGLIAIETDAGTDSRQTMMLSGGMFSGTVSDLPGGQYNVRAHYAGDATFAASDSAVLAVAITPEDSTTTVAAAGLASGTAAYGAPLQVKVSVAGKSAQGVASGTIQLADNTNNVVYSSQLAPDGTAYFPTGGGASFAFAPGSHSLTASYSGDNSFHTSSSTPLSFTIGKGTPFVVVGVNSLTVPVGGTIGAHAIVSGEGTAAATGAVQFTCDGTPCGPSTALQTGGLFGSQAQASVLLSGLTAGTHVIGASYDGSADPNYVSVTSGDTTNEVSATVTVGSNPGTSSATTLVVGPAPVKLGDTGTFVVTVTPKTATGTVTIWDAVGPRSAATPITSGTATIQFAWTQAGTASVYAVYSGDSTNAGSSSSATTFTVQKGVPQVSLSAPTTVSANQQASVVVSVTGIPGNAQLPYPTGIVEIWDSLDGGAAQLVAKQIVTAGPAGSAVYGARLKFAPGVHSVHSHYEGDTNWQAKDSTAVQLSSSTFALSMTSFAMTAGSAGSGTVTITPSGGFTGTVALTCATGTTALPAGYTCAFAQADVPVTSGAATTTVTLTPASTAAGAVKTAERQDHPSRSLPLLAGLLVIGLLGLAIGFGTNGRNFAVIAGLIVLAAAVYGCGGGGGGGGGGGPFNTILTLSSSASKAAFGSPVTITATVTPSGAATPSGTVQLFDNGQALGSPVRVSSGIATFVSTTLPVGVHELTAQYSGDANSRASTTAQPLAQSITGQVMIEVTGSSNGIVQTADFTVTLN